ncbi:MAG: RNA polymerase sigma factor [Actinomycetota bacterium]
MVPFEDFYRSEYGRVFGALYVATGSADLAQDATQEAFQRAFARWRRLGEEQWAAGWVVTTALNHSRRLARRAKREPTSFLTETSLEGGEPEANRVDLVRSVRTLPRRQREAIVLYYLLDLPIPAVAMLMDQTEGSVKAHLAHARRKLREAMVVADA